MKKIAAFFALALVLLGLKVNGELIQAYLEKLSDDPASGGEGRVYYNTTEKKAKIHNGTGFVPLGSGSGGGSVNYIGSPDSAINWLGLGLTPSTTADPDHLPRAPYDTQALLIETPDTLGTDARARYCFEIGESDKYKILQLSAAVRSSSSYQSGEMRFLIRGWTGAACTGFTRSPLLLDEGISKSDFYGEFYADPGFGSGAFENGYASYELSVIASTTDAPEEGDWLALSSITVGPDTRIMGAVSYREVITPGGDFTGGGDLVVSRTGDTVTITVTGALTFTSAASASSATGVLPEWARPAVQVGNVYLRGSADVRTAFVQTNGTFGVSARNWSGSTTNIDTTTSEVTITYQAADGKGTTRMLSTDDLYANASIGLQLDSTLTVSSNLTSPEAAITSNPVNLDWDSENSIVTIKADGRYEISTSHQVDNLDTATWVQSAVYLNGLNSGDRISISTSEGIYTSPAKTVVRDLAKGDKIYWRFNRSVGSPTIRSGPFTTFSITRISDTTGIRGRGVGAATATDPGFVTPEDQTWAGDKTFEGNVDVGGNLRVEGTVSSGAMQFLALSGSATPLFEVPVGSIYRVTAARYGSGGSFVIEAIVSRNSDGIVISPTLSHASMEFTVDENTLELTRNASGSSLARVSWTRL